MENKLKHLDMIQAVISRMASNSFALKGWAVTLMAGIFALASKDSDKMYFAIAFIPLIVFWFLDSYYLQQERLFRNLYNKVRIEENDKKIDFSMNVKVNNKDEIKKEKLSFFSCLFSMTEHLFYLPLCIVTLVICMNWVNIFSVFFEKIFSIGG